MRAQKPTVWRWQERYLHEGVAGLKRDKTRPSRVPPLPMETRLKVIARTVQETPPNATHWSRALMAEAMGISPSSVGRIWAASISGYKYSGAQHSCAHAYLLPAVHVELQRVKSQLQDGKSRLFDLGCGNGSVAAALAADGWDVYVQISRQRSPGSTQSTA